MANLIGFVLIASAQNNHQQSWWNKKTLASSISSEASDKKESNKKNPVTQKHASLASCWEKVALDYDSERLDTQPANSS